MANYDTLPGAIANADMSTMQFSFVNMSGSTSVDFEIQQSTSATVRYVGILMNAPTSSGQPAEVALPGGVAKLRFDGSITQGGLIVCSSGGKGVADSTNAGEWVGAESLQTGTSTGVFYVRILQAFQHST